MSAPVLSREEVVTLLDRAVRRAGSQGAWARAHGLDQRYISEVLRGVKPPSERITDALGLVRIVRYAQVGGGQ